MASGKAGEAAALLHSRPSCAVHGSGNSRRHAVFEIPLDGLDDELQLIGAVYFSGDAVVVSWDDVLSLGEVVPPINSPCRVVSHEEDHTVAALEALEQGEMIGAEVAHREKRKEREPPPPLLMISAVVELAAGLLRTGYHHSAAHCLKRVVSVLRLAPFAFAQALAAEQKHLGVLHQAVGDGGGDGRVVEDVAPVGKRGIGGDEGTFLFAVAGGDDLIEEVGSLLIEGKIPQLVADQQ